MDLLEAWRRRRASDDALLVVVGPDMTGHPGTPADRRARSSPARPRRSRALRRPAADPSRFYRAADIFVQPSHFEALGNTAIEAMASGLPVVASGVGGLGDFFVDGENALLHRPRDRQHRWPPRSRRCWTTRRCARGSARRSAHGRPSASSLAALLDRYARLVDRRRRSGDADVPQHRVRQRLRGQRRRCSCC